MTLMLAVAGCAAPRAPQQAAEPAEPAPAVLAALLPADLLLVGEQHDAPQHQHIQRALVEQLAARGALAALALEMAEAGTSTAGLPRDAGEDRVRAALRWDDAAWPWRAYGPVVMAGVRAGVLVLGANLPRSQMRAAMADTTLDARLPPAALQAQQTAIRDGHCNLLPATQIVPMTRIQIARDLRIAQTVQAARAPGRTVLLVAGAGHVLRDRGVPVHLAPELTTRVLVLRAGDGTEPQADRVLNTPALPPTDYCAALRASAPRAPAAQ